MKKTYDVISCDAPRCPAKVSAPIGAEAIKLTLRAGWFLSVDGTDDRCPAHIPAKETIP